MRHNPYGEDEFGREATWEAMRDDLISRQGYDIERDDRMQELFDRLLPEYRDQFPTGTQQNVDSYIESAYEALDDYLDELFGENLAEWFDWEDWADWREAYEEAS